MKRNPFMYARILLSLAVLACSSASFVFMYQAGCAGDLKGGSLGDPALALQMESQGVALGWLSVLLLATTVASIASLKPGQRIAGVIAALVVGFIAVTIIGIQLEVRGVQSCF